MILDPRTARVLARGHGDVRRRARGAQGRAQGPLRLRAGRRPARPTGGDRRPSRVVRAAARGARVSPAATAAAERRHGAGAPGPRRRPQAGRALALGRRGGRPRQRPGAPSSRRSATASPRSPTPSTSRACGMVVPGHRARPRRPPAAARAPSARGLRAATRRDRPTTLLDVADRLLREDTRRAALARPSACWSATIRDEPERTWQLVRAEARRATEWATVDTPRPRRRPRDRSPSPTAGRSWSSSSTRPRAGSAGSPASTIATLPHVDHDAGRQPGGRPPRPAASCGDLIGDAGARRPEGARRGRSAPSPSVDLAATVAFLRARGRDRRGDRRRPPRLGDPRQPVQAARARRARSCGPRSRASAAGPAPRPRRAPPRPPPTSSRSAWPSRRPSARSSTAPDRLT